MEVLTNIADKIGFDWRLSVSHLINLLIIFFLLVKFAFPAIKKTVSERTQKIKEGLKMREDANKIVEQANAEAKDIHRTANLKSQDIISNSETNAKNIISQANEKKSEIIKDAEDIKEQAKETGMKEAENILQRDISKILTKISDKAFSGKVTGEVNNDFISKVFN
jgi:F-type H+-transporting ATPase subunit b